MLAGSYSSAAAEVITCIDLAFFCSTDKQRFSKRELYTAEECFKLGWQGSVDAVRTILSGVKHTLGRL